MKCETVCIILVWNVLFFLGYVVVRVKLTIKRVLLACENSCLRRGLPLPLVRRVEDLGSGLPRSYSLMSLAASQALAAAGGEKAAPRSLPHGYSRPSWFWRYGRDTGWLEQRAHHNSVLGSRFWPSVAHFRRTYDAGRPSFTYPSWQVLACFFSVTRPQHSRSVLSYYVLS